ncbi:MAG TPA: CBS domain-containing protein [Bacteroidales bacterium]|nr:CBS domain-containing protein [Bacteroidales bacterium]
MPSVKTSDTGNKALSWMEFFKVSHLPIVNNEDFLGLISESDIYNLNCGEEAIGNHKLSLIRPYVTEEQHLWEVAEIVAKLKLTLIPVLSQDSNAFLGSIILPELVQHMARIVGSDENGSIIVLEMGVRDYSLTEIARIVEEENTKILGLYVSGTEDSMKINVTLKLDTTHITAILRSFDRYDYNIRASFMMNDDVNSLYKDRYESFLSYLNV